ncbi:MAG: hypothetical protein ACJ76A_06595 [Actinomycetota bacterium]
MTASRTCRACGAKLPGDVRSCGQCHEPVRELTPREPIWHDGEFVDQPIHTGGAIPHWSRWEKSATTFGPVGRLAITTIAVLWVASAAVRSPLTIVFVLPLVVALIRSVWQRGWVVPDPAARRDRDGSRGGRGLGAAQGERTPTLRRPRRGRRSAARASGSP